MAAGGEPSLRVLQRGKDEEIGALVEASVALLELAERGFERGEVAHGCASGRRLSPDTRARAPLTRGVGSRSAWASTSSMVSTGVMSSSCFTSSGTSTRSLLFRAGTRTRFTPARAAAVSFSFKPPIGSTRPRSVSSPVMARSLRAGRRHSSEASAVAIVIPAEGPSLGTAPAGLTLHVRLPGVPLEGRGGHGDPLRSLLDDLERRLAEHALNLALQLAHARLARVLGDEPLQRGVGDARLHRREAGLDQLSRQQVLLRDRELLARRVPG